MRPAVSTKDETIAVMRAACAVFFAAWLAIGLHAGAPPGADVTTANDLLPWQRLFRDLDPRLQRMYRAMEEGEGEAERTRADTKSWPDAAALAADGIPPFAPDPIDRAGYAWRSQRDGLVVNYRGTPKDAAAPELLVVVQEPEPGAVDLGAAAADETHHRLSDGTLLHVTFWYREGRATGSAVVDRPFAEGWTQILAGTSAKKEPAS